MVDDVDWALVDKALFLGQDPITREKRKDAFDTLDPNKNHKLTLTEVKGGILGYLSDDNARAAGEKAKYIVPLKDFSQAIKESFQIARDMATKPSSKRCSRRGQTDTNLDRSEFHPFLVALRQYLEMALVFESLDKSGDHKLSYKEVSTTRGKKLFEEWDIDPKELRGKFPSDVWEEALDYSHFAEWLIHKRCGALNLELDDSDNEEVVKEQAAHDVRAAEDIRFGDKKMGKSLEDSQNQRKVTEAFSKWDPDHSGGITEDEMKSVLQKLNPNLSTEAISKIFKAADSNRDGIIDYNEFVAWLFTAGK